MPEGDDTKVDEALGQVRATVLDLYQGLQDSGLPDNLALAVALLFQNACLGQRFASQLAAILNPRERDQLVRACKTITDLFLLRA